MNTTKLLALALLLLMALSTGCAYGARGTNRNMHMQGVFQFDFMQNDTGPDKDTLVAEASAGRK